MDDENFKSEGSSLENLSLEDSFDHIKTIEALIKF